MVVHAGRWQGELVKGLHFSAAHFVARTGIRKDVPPAEFLLGCFPQGAGSQTPASAPPDGLGLLLSSWAPGVFPGSDFASRARQRRSSLWDSGVCLCLWWQWTESCIGSALFPAWLSRGLSDLWCFRREDPDRDGARRKRWCLSSDNRCSIPPQGSLRAAGSRRGEDLKFTSLKAKRSMDEGSSRMKPKGTARKK